MLRRLGVVAGRGTRAGLVSATRAAATHGRRLGTAGARAAAAHGRRLGTAAQDVARATSQAVRRDAERLCSRVQLHPSTLQALLNTSYVCTCAALMMSEVLWVRAVMMLGQGISISFNLLQPRPMLLPARWNAFFMALNAYHVAKLLLEKRPLTLSEDEAALFAKAFQPFEITPRQFLRLMEAGEWVHFRPGEHLTEHGHVNSRLVVIDEGAADVWIGDRVVGKCLPANYVGEMTFLNNKDGAAACATVSASTPIKAVAWDRARLRALLADDPELGIKLKETITHDVMRKMDKDHEHATSGTASRVFRAALAGRYLSPETRRELEGFHGTPDFDLERAVASCGWTMDEFRDGVRARR